MRHSTYTTDYVTDYVLLYKSHFPHVVKIDPSQHLIDQIHSWLKTHVGQRQHDWQYPKDDTYMFKNDHHATMFALMFT